jgi:hypothetical protein
MTRKTKLRILRPQIRTLSSAIIKASPKKAEAFYVSPEWRAFRAEMERQRGRRCQYPQCGDPHAPGPRYLDHIQ